MSQIRMIRSPSLINHRPFFARSRRYLKARASASEGQFMRPPQRRPNARLISLKQAEEEYGLSQTLLLDLAKRGELIAVRPPNVRRIFLDRADLESKLPTWRA